MATAKKRAQNRSGGRSTGNASRTMRPQVIQEHLARCVECGSTELKVLRIRRRIDHCGIDQDGRPYTSLIWRTVKCKCGTLQAKRTPEYDPQRWK